MQETTHLGKWVLEKFVGEEKAHGEQWAENLDPV